MEMRNQRQTLIFELNARLIEESGIVHWFETKFPDLKKWAKEVENEYRSYVKIFKPIGLEKRVLYLSNLVFLGLRNY